MGRQKELHSIYLAQQRGECAAAPAKHQAAPHNLNFTMVMSRDTTIKLNPTTRPRSKGAPVRLPSPRKDASQEETIRQL